MTTPESTGLLQTSPGSTWHLQAAHDTPMKHRTPADISRKHLTSSGSTWHPQDSLDSCRHLHEAHDTSRKHRTPADTSYHAVQDLDCRCVHSAQGNCPALEANNGSSFSVWLGLLQVLNRPPQQQKETKRLKCTGWLTLQSLVVTVMFESPS